MNGCQGCGAPPTHWDGVGRLCDDCFDRVFRNNREGLARHRAECGGACYDERNDDSGIVEFP